MAKKGKDSRPTRSKQKERSVKNKIKQIEKHLEKNPKDKYAQEKLQRAKKGNSRAATGCGPQPKVPDLSTRKQGKRK